MLEAITFGLLTAEKVKVSRHTWLVLALLAGISASLAAGFFLSRRRRRYRAIPLDVRTVQSGTGGRGSTLTRSSTFGRGSVDREERRQSRHRRRHRSSRAAATEDEMTDSSPHAGTNSHVLDKDQVDLVRGRGQGDVVPLASGSVDCDTASVSSNDSFHSTLESLEDLEPTGGYGLYLSALGLARKNGLTCRNIRTAMLNCTSDSDFLAKVHCVRLAFDDIISSKQNRDYFKVTARELVSAFLTSTNQDPTRFCDHFDNLIEYVESEEGWKIAVEELTHRKVACMNVYDIALDFVLLDAFDDIEHPPSAIVSVLSNTWITAGMKQSMISAAIWSLLKAKSRMLTHRDGFMSRFYLMSQTLSPTLAWGFLGTDQQLKDKCIHFKAVTMTFIRSMFSLEAVDYTSVKTLADDILRLAKQTADTMHTSATTLNNVDSL